jgi:hypothetical protein
MGVALLIKYIPGKSTSIIDSPHGINKVILCSENNYVDHTNEEYLLVLTDNLELA